jgi:hypothetical protein
MVSAGTSEPFKLCRRITPSPMVIIGVACATHCMHMI